MRWQMKKEMVLKDVITVEEGIEIIQSYFDLQFDEKNVKCELISDDYKYIVKSKTVGRCSVQLNTFTALTYGTTDKVLTKMMQEYCSEKSQDYKAALISFNYSQHQEELGR